ncbi:MAG TPA: pilus assembly protein TadG-related protein [Terriglobales bacterium]|nr:pilus assembly protein TadG-related protein [Terriglobales bacterium]
MPSHRVPSRRQREPGFIITLIAVFLLFVVGAMAALSIDIVTFYTARSEAQLAADAAALAGARVMANSGVTSEADTGTETTMMTNTKALALAVAKQVAQSNSVGGQLLSAGNVIVSFNGDVGSPCIAAILASNPCVTAKVTRSDLPVFFARIWGSTQITVTATATAEAYNPSGLATGVSTSAVSPVAPTCVKPWLMPNIDPTSSSSSPTKIFDLMSGQIVNSGLLGMTFPNATQSGAYLYAQCGPNGNGCSSNKAWQYLVGDDNTSFPPPTQALPSCTLNTAFELGIAGCVQQPVVCGSAPASQVYVLIASDGTLDQQAATAVNCLAHTSGGQGDKIGTGVLPPLPFQFTAGDDNPLVQAGTLTSQSNIMVSDSLVTVPVYDPSSLSGNQVNVIGFLQLFLQPDGSTVPASGGIKSEIVNMVGCGNTATGTPVYGNGASAVPVRLINHP